MTTGPADVRGMTMPPDPDDDGGDIEFDPIWDARRVLGHVQQFARSRRTSPLATLGAVLRNVVAATPPHVVLPPTIGGYVAPNLFVAPCGRSGQGKDAANAAANDALTIKGGVEVQCPNLGSGEGLARVFAGHGKGDNAVPGAHSAQIVAPEIRTLGALASRSAATIEGELLKGYMGQSLGFSNAHSETTTAVAALSYRLCMSVGVQPENVDFFTAREKDGFPQRWLFLPTIDADAPDDRPDEPEPWVVTIPDFPKNDRSGHFHVIDVPAAIKREIDYHRVKVLRGDDGVDPLHSHRMLTRLKVAFALAVLSDRGGVDADDWRLGGALMDVSDRTFNGMRSVLREKRRRENRLRAEDAADRQAIVEARLVGNVQARVGQTIIAKLKRVSKATRADLRRAVRSNDRGEFDPVFEMFLDKKFIVCCGATTGGADEYQIA